MESVISFEGLTMAYGSCRCCAASTSKFAGAEVCAIVGPNGAGRTTLVEILEGYRVRSGGRVSVLRVEPGRPTRAFQGLVSMDVDSSI